jgi:diguanylate cyclase (GGDEF)-like protein
MSITEKNFKVLIVDDERANLNILIELLKPQYKIMAANSGQKALKALMGASPPDLVLLDIMMPDMDGYEVCRQIKSHDATCDIPVIFVTAMSEVSDETKGFKLGAVDYITKPISPSIVQARVETHLGFQYALKELKRLYSFALDSNPMTGLPGNNTLTKRIKQALKQKEAVCVIYSDLDNFKAFNDKYGFALGDEVLLFTSNIFTKVVKRVNLPDAFVGHIGGDDFIVIVPSTLAQKVADEIIQVFDKGITSFYSDEDVKANCIHSVNRQGEKQTFPLMSISLACVDLSHNRFNRFVEVNDACTEAKKKAKSIPGSSFFMDRRRS